MVASTCSFQDKSEETITKSPNPLHTSHVFQGTERSCLCVIRSAPHLSGLKCSCHFDVQDTNLSISDCKASLSLAMFDSSLYSWVSSADILSVEEMLYDMSLM